MAFIKVGNKVLKCGGKVVTNDPNPLKLPPFTIRCKFSSGYTPTMGDSQTLVDATENVWDITKANPDWTKLFDGDQQPFPYLLNVLGANTTGVTNMSYMFRRCTELSYIALFDTSTVTSTFNMLHRCESLTSIPQYDLSSVTDIRQMFYACTGLTTLRPLYLPSVTTTMNMFSDCTGLSTVTLVTGTTLTNVQGTFQRCTSLLTVSISNTSKVTAFNAMCSGCTSLVSIPQVDTSSATGVRAMLNDCFNVQSGILDFYRQLSNQASPPSNHVETFNNCGINGPAADELDQIPADWGGTKST